MDNVWVQSANNFSIREISQQLPVLPVGVYKLEKDPFENLYLSQIQEKFGFPYKVYGVERSFIDRVKKSWNHTTGNFGVLLNGIKGTGKTVTAEIICNELDLPVIIIPWHHENLVSFLNNIQQDVIIFIDEFEKIYDGYDNSLLSIMDGALKTKHRLFFLLTTNELRVDRNLLQRPSRIRYVKTFEDLTLEVIMEVVNDLLINKELYNLTVKFISELPLITMDLVKSIISEVNIHDEDPNNFKDIFNLHEDKDDIFNVYEIIDGEKQEVDTYVTIRPSYISEHTSIAEEFYIGRSYRGQIKRVISDNQIVVENTEYELQEDSKGNSKNVSVDKQRIYYLEKSAKTHKAFASMDLAF